LLDWFSFPFLFFLQFRFAFLLHSPFDWWRMEGRHANGNAAAAACRRGSAVGNSIWLVSDVDVSLKARTVTGAKEMKNQKKN